jgi:Tetratricopeptide repeat
MLRPSHCFRHSKTVRAGFAAAAFILWTAIGWQSFRPRLYGQEPATAQHDSAISTNPRPVLYQNTRPGVEYAGSKVCASCHPDIYSSFIKTDMGRSFSLPESPEQLAITSKPVTIHQNDRFFQVFRKGSDVYQSEYQLGPDGKEVFRDTHKIAYVMGAGAAGYSYLVHEGNYLFQAPLSYYTGPKSWELSPGYETGDYGFSRPIRAMCITCHSGRAQPVPQRNGLYKDPPFLQMSIGCENCHGPGELHVKSVMAGSLPKGKVDRTIVNPADLPGWLADNICMSCHQGGDERVLQAGKNFTDFRPGTPLDETYAIFALPFSKQRPPESPLLQHFELMVMSKCYRATGGKLHCITCHDAHRQPSAAQAPAYYRQKCLMCHTVKSCSLPLKTRLQQHPADNCIGCHMPKEKLHLVSHAALTDHRIIAYAGEPFPEAVYHQTSPQLPDLIHFDAIPGDKTPPSPLVVLQAYRHFADQYPSFRPKYLALLQELEQGGVDSPILASAAAQAATHVGSEEEAAEVAQTQLARAIKLGSTEPKDYELYAATLVQTGRLEEAIDVLKRGIALDPYYFHFYRDLARCYVQAKQFDDALQTIKQELKLYPQDSDMRKILESIEGRSGPS